MGNNSYWKLTNVFYIFRKSHVPAVNSYCQLLDHSSGAKHQQHAKAHLCAKWYRVVKHARDWIME